jgi:alcohol dehydrogenase (cytochrome c)
VQKSSKCVAVVGLYCAYAIIVAVHAASTHAVIDDERLASAATDPSSWLTFGHNYTNQRYSGLTQITVDNVADLTPAWTYRSGAKGPFQVQPLVADGVMYVTLPGNDVAALDAATGSEQWRYRHLKRYERTLGSPANRGAALAYGKVYEATNDGRLIALDQTTGETVWDRVIVQPLAEELEGVDAEARLAWSKNIDRLPAKMAPLVFSGMVIVGVTSAGYGIYYNLGSEPRVGPAPPLTNFLGQRGFVAAFDASTGNEIWRWYTTRSGDWEGEFSETTSGGEKLSRDLNSEREAAKQAGENWRVGGSSTWSTPSLDPDLGLLYVGTGNASPNDVPAARPGDNLYASSLVALDVNTGSIRWHYQQVPQDIWGYDVASASVLFDATIQGEAIPAVGIAGKTGWFYVHVHDRRTGKLLYRSQPLIPQQNMFARPTLAGTVVAPGSFGGVSWSPGSFDSKRHLMYLAAIHKPTRLTLNYANEASGRVAYVSTDVALDAPTWGTLSAIDTNNNGTLRWQVKTEQPLVGGVLATAGGLVFVGEGDGTFAAFDAANGQRLWGYACGAGVNAPPVSYRVGDTQFVAVAAGGSKYFGFAPGDSLTAFALAK